MAIARRERTLYRELIRAAWELTWHRKEFWVLGFFAAFLGNGGAVDAILRAAGKISSAIPFLEGYAYTRSVYVVLLYGTFAERATIILTLLIVITVGALVVIAAISSMGGIIHAAARRVGRQKVAPRAALIEGTMRFWPLLLIQFLGRTLTFALLSLTVAGYFLSSFIVPRAGILYLILFIVFALAALFVSFMMAVSSAAIVVEDASWAEAVRRAWRLLTGHWLVSLEMIFVLFAIDITVAFGVVAAALILTIPFILLFLAASILGSAIGFIVVATLASLTGLALIVIAGSALATFQHTAWTLLYLRIRERTVVGKLERLFRSLRKRAHA